MFRALLAWSFVAQATEPLPGRHEWAYVEAVRSFAAWLDLEQGRAAQAKQDKP